MSFNYSPKVVTSGLSLYLDAANQRSYSGSGTTWYNLVSPSNNGTLVNSPTFSSNNAGVIVTNGSNNYISITLPTFSSTYSISFWVKPLALPAGAGSEIQLFGSPGDVASISLYAAVSNTYKFLSWNGGTGRTGNTTLSINNWYNFVMVNSTNTVFYLNGATDGTFANTATLNSGAATFACINGTSRFLNSNLGTIIFYNKALSSAEVLQNYNATKTRFGL
jgi:hypothetical protein